MTPNNHVHPVFQGLLNNISGGISIAEYKTIVKAFDKVDKIVRLSIKDKDCVMQLIGMDEDTFDEKINNGFSSKEINELLDIAKLYPCYFVGC